LGEKRLVGAKMATTELEGDANQAIFILAYITRIWGEFGCTGEFGRFGKSFSSIFKLQQ